MLNKHNMTEMMFKDEVKGLPWRLTTFIKTEGSGSMATSLWCGGWEVLRILHLLHELRDLKPRSSQ